MPAESKAQRKLMAIAKYHPEMVYEKNKGVLKMSKKQLGDYAGTKEANLPERKKLSKSLRKKRS